MDKAEEFIENAVCELHMTVGEETKIKWNGNGPGRLMAVLTLVETLAKMLGVDFETIIACLYQAHEAIEQEEVEDGQRAND